MLAAAGVAVPPAAPAPAPAPASHPTQPAPPPYLSASAPPPNQPQLSVYAPAILPPSHTPVHHSTTPVFSVNTYAQPSLQMSPSYYLHPPPPMQPIHASSSHMQAPPPHAVAPPPACFVPGFNEAQTVRVLLQSVAVAMLMKWNGLVQNMVMQVLQLTPEHLNSLPPQEREQIMQLVCRAPRRMTECRSDCIRQRRQFGLNE